MYIHTIRYNGEIVLQTKSYNKAYNYLAKVVQGGMSFGMDYHTLLALGYECHSLAVK